MTDESTASCKTEPDDESVRGTQAAYRKVLKFIEEVGGIDAVIDANSSTSRLRYSHQMGGPEVLSRNFGEIANALTLYAGLHRIDKPDRLREVSSELRSLAARLHTTLWTIPLYWLLRVPGGLPREEAIQTASRELVGWSNGFRDEEEDDRRRRIIAECLNIQMF